MWEERIIRRDFDIIFLKNLELISIKRIFLIKALFR